MIDTVAVFGLGNVGLVCAICLSESQNVIGIELNQLKVESLKSGKSYIYEDQLDELISWNSTRLTFTSSHRDAYCANTIVLCVGTPSLSNGNVNLDQVLNTAKEIGELLKQNDRFRHIILRSTVPPGTTRKSFIPAIEQSSGKRCGIDFIVTYNPEFLREGSAVKDWKNPSITVVGTSDGKPLDLACEMYGDYDIEWCRFEDAEMIKYLSNSYHALKVAFANEMGAVAHQLGVDNSRLFEMFFKDTKLNISSRYLSPGMSYGGPCLTKDVQGFKGLSQFARVETPLISSLIDSNNIHSDRFLSIIEQGGYEKIFITGLCFKRETNDFRKSPIVRLITQLLSSPSYLQKNITVLERESVIHELSDGMKVNFVSEVNEEIKDVELIVIGPYFDQSLLQYFCKNVHILSLGFYPESIFSKYHLLRVV